MDHGYDNVKDANPRGVSTDADGEHTGGNLSTGGSGAQSGGDPEQGDDMIGSTTPDTLGTTNPDTGLTAGGTDTMINRNVTGRAVEDEAGEPGPDKGDAGLGVDPTETELMGTDMQPLGTGAGGSGSGIDAGNIDALSGDNT